jgi:hypothetical protein
LSGAAEGGFGRNETRDSIGDVAAKDAGPAPSAQWNCPSQMSSQSPTLGTRRNRGKFQCRRMAVHPNHLPTIHLGQSDNGGAIQRKRMDWKGRFPVDQRQKMKFIILYLILSFSIAGAAELAPLLAKLEPCKRIDVIGQVRTSGPGMLPIVYKKVDFQTGDAQKMELLLKWLKEIPAKDTNIRFNGEPSVTSTREMLVFKLTGKDEKFHWVVINGLKEFIFDANELFKSDVRVDTDLLFATIESKSPTKPKALKAGKK